MPRYTKQITNLSKLDFESTIILSFFILATWGVPSRRRVELLSVVVDSLGAAVCVVGQSVYLALRFRYRSFLHCGLPGYACNHWNAYPSRSR